MFKPL